MTTQTKRALIFGISGQDGAYLARLLLDKGYTVFGTSRDAEMTSAANLVRLGVRERVTLISSVPSDYHSATKAITQARPDEIYNLSGQSSVGLSFEQPAETLNSIALGTLNILDAVRATNPDIRFYNASSGECFGDTNGVPANEKTAFNPCSPYAIAKAAAYWEVANYRAAYGLYACSGILFNHESPLRPARFVTQKIIQGAVKAARGQTDKLHLGDLTIRRDWGWAPEYVDAMWRMLQQDSPDDFVIATGRSYPLEDFVKFAYAHFDLDYRDHVVANEQLLRPTELMHGLGDASKAAQHLNWRPSKEMPDVVNAMADAEMARQKGEDEHL
ncbi:GDP-mannose 4,6-dehydratase [Magnetovibrio sp.]|uniref:GDP-mannose 4,6-dehydratase n=1 Tax=Magnetovibrio sp. TaxID=2024836 RepID=UPI002F9224E5